MHFFVKQKSRYCENTIAAKKRAVIVTVRIIMRVFHKSTRSVGETSWSRFLQVGETSGLDVPVARGPLGGFHTHIRAGFSAIGAWRGTGPRPTVKGAVPATVARGPVPRDRWITRAMARDRPSPYDEGIFCRPIASRPGGLSYREDIKYETPSVKFIEPPILPRRKTKRL